MVQARPFAYNSGSTISGTLQVGNLAIGVDQLDYSQSPGGVQWWNGPDESIGYVIAHPVETFTQPNPLGIPAGVGFWRSKFLTDESFVNLANNIPPTSGVIQFSTATDASIWLTNNGYWNSYIPPVLYLDAGNPLSYPGSGSTWTDLVGGKTFTLYNGPTFSSSDGGKINFVANSNQYGYTTTSLPSLSAWTVAVWHYWDGTNTSLSPCIVTEKWPNTTANINFSLGNNSDSNPLLQVGFFNGGWRNTPTFSLTANTWYYIVGTYDGSTVKLYVDGSLVQSTNYVGTPISGGQGIILMRRWDDPPGGYWGGSLGTVSIYDKAISNTQISYIYNSTKTRFIPTPTPTPTSTATPTPTPTPTSSIVTNGLQLWLDAGDSSSYPGTGTTWYDLSANHVNATLINGVGYSSLNGGSLTFDGSNDYVDTNQSLASASYTISAWYKCTNASNYRMIVSKETNAGGPWNYRMYLGSGNGYLIGDITATSGGQVVDSNNYANDTWVNTVFVRDVASDNLYLYVNGSLVQTENDTSSGTVTNPQNVWIGRSAYLGGSYPFLGNISIVMIYDRALNSTEILQNFDANKSRYGL